MEIYRKGNYRVSGQEASAMTVKDMIKNEIDNLPDNVLNEVYDFILFLETKKEKALLAKASQQLSQASFDKIWINEEDAVYDTL
jgi:hypothetical protein